MIARKGPHGLYDNWFRSSRLCSRGVANALYGQCDDIRSRSSTCREAAVLCCLELEEALDVARHTREHERVGKANRDRNKWVCGIPAAVGGGHDSVSTLTFRKWTKRNEQIVCVVL